MADTKTTKKTVVFAPQTLSSVGLDTDGSPFYRNNKEDIDRSPVDDLKNTLSSFWTFNPEFFDYPAISFHEEGSVTWAKIIEENIFQPFLPKNRLILQHIIKGLKQEQQQKFSIFDERKDIKMPLKKLGSFSDNTPSGNVNHIEKILNEIRGKIEKKNERRVKRSKADQYEARSMNRNKTFLRKKDQLLREQAENGLVNHRLYDLDLSLQEIEREEFFEFDDFPEPEQEIPKKEQPKTKKNSDFGSIRLTTNTSVSSQKAEKPVINLPKAPKEQLISKKLIRRKSCCCSICGGISSFEKKTVDIVPNKEQGFAHTLSIPINRSFLQVGLPAGGRDRNRRTSRVSNAGGITPRNFCDDKTPSMRTPRNQILQRRNSGNNLGADLLQPPSRRQSRNLTLIVTSRNTPSNESAMQLMAKPRNSPAGFTLAVPSFSNLDTRPDYQEPKERAIDSASRKHGYSKSEQVILTVESHTEIKPEKTLLIGMSNIKKKNKRAVKNLEISKVNQLTRPVHVSSHTQNAREILTLKHEDSFKGQLPTPLTATSTTERSGLSHRRNYTFSYAPLPSSARLKTDTATTSSGKPAHKKKLSQQIHSKKPYIIKKGSINKVYMNKGPKVPAIGIPLQLQLSSPLSSTTLLTSPYRTHRPTEPSLFGLKASSEPVPFVSPRENNSKKGLFRINKPKSLSISAQSSIRTPTCPV